ncbi:MAG: TatD DNase family protein [Gammaproteobacteria bacterium]|jgi:TatD DNase family protein|tara:strand:+ start:181 stop:981 length:801 start_codon:yes stop_codon:yes gene_type:complete
MQTLIDIGANLTHDSFDRDRDAVLERAFTAGVARMIVTGADLHGSTQALALAQAHPGVLWATSGVHPHYANDYTAETGGALARLAQADEVVAIGEMGLDYFRNLSSHAEQEYAFDSQLQIAATTGKPVFLHQRDAHQAFVAILKNHLPSLSGGVAHCFTGTKEQMHAYLDMGLHIGITGWICDERRGHDLQEAVASLPLDRVLLETDAPYLLPRDLNKAQKQQIDGRRCEPALLPHVLEATAGYMNVDPASLAEQATANTKRLFGL